MTSLSFLDQITLGLGVALSLNNLLFCALGVLLGMFVGVLPGVGAIAAISMLFPVTYHLDATTAIIMMAGVYYGTAYGGSITAILLNVPGTSSAAVTSLDGYPMAQQGRAGAALFLTTVASFFAGCVGILLMTVFSPSLAQLALGFQAPEYFSMMALGLVAAASVASGSALKGLAMMVVGILCGVVGMDIYSGVERFTFGSLDLIEGISMVAVAMGLFGVTEVIANTNSPDANVRFKVSLRSLVPTRDEARRSVGPSLRGTAIGSLIGILPGAGGTVASFISYAFEKRVARDKGKFGKGAVEGVVSPEAANNAADQTSFIPTLALGIPGSATMAIMLGILIINNITPGPRLMTERPDLFWGLVMSFWVGNLLLLVLNLPLIGIWVRLLQIPQHYLYPAIIVFICIGVYSVHSSTLDINMVIAFGVAGVVMRYLNLPPAPLLIGFILGPMLEVNFRRAMIVSRGELDIFLQRPISLVCLTVAAVLVGWSLYGAIRAGQVPKSVAA